MWCSRVNCVLRLHATRRVRIESSQKASLHTSKQLNEDTTVTKTAKKGPIKFTSSDAHLNYKAVRNFYGDDKDLPKSHNIVLASTGIAAIYYLLYLRDDGDNEGGLALIKPLHESMPSMAVPLLEAAIAENKKFGNNTQKLEKRLAEYMKEPEKHGAAVRRKLVEN